MWCIRRKTCKKMVKWKIVLFSFLFPWRGMFVPLKIFSLIWRRYHYWWWATNLTFARHSWPLSSESSFFTCHTYSDTGQPFIMVISGKTHDTHTCCRKFSSGAVTTCYKDLVRPRIESRSPACEDVVLNEAGNDLFRERHHLYYYVLYFRPLWINLKLG